MAQLYYGTQGTPETSLISVTNPPGYFRLPTTSVPGTWTAGGTRWLIGIGDDGEFVTLQVRVWDIALGRDYETAFQSANGLFTGKSLPFSYFSFWCNPPYCYWMENFRG